MTLHADAYRVLNKTVTGRKLPAETFGAGDPTTGRLVDFTRRMSTRRRDGADNPATTDDRS
jgi:hypothetical protein